MKRQTKRFSHVASQRLRIMVDRQGSFIFWTLIFPVLFIVLSACFIKRATTPRHGRLPWSTGTRPLGRLFPWEGRIPGIDIKLADTLPAYNRLIIIPFDFSQDEDRKTKPWP
jgi:hypothetical protein